MASETAEMLYLKQNRPPKIQPSELSSAFWIWDYSDSKREAHGCQFDFRNHSKARGFCLALASERAYLFQGPPLGDRPLPSTFLFCAVNNDQSISSHLQTGSSWYQGLQILFFGLIRFLMILFFSLFNFVFLFLSHQY